MTTQAALILASILKGWNTPNGEPISSLHFSLTLYQVAFQSVGFSLYHWITSVIHFEKLLSDGMT